MKIAIAVTVLDRPAHLRVCLQHLQRSLACSEPLPVYVFQDSPRKPRDRYWWKTHDLARRTRWVQHVVRPENVGYRNIVQSVTELLAQYDAAVVIQDDVCLSADAVGYFTEALRRFARANSVFAVCAGQYDIPTLERHPRRALFARFFDPQASAFWRRSWVGLDPACAGFEQLLRDCARLQEFNVLGGTYMSDLLRNALQNGEFLWDMFWYFHLFERRGYSLFPKRSLVLNTGAFGGSHMDHVIRMRGDWRARLLLRFGMRRFLYHRVTQGVARLAPGRLADYRHGILDPSSGEWPAVEEAESDHRAFCAALDAHGMRWSGRPSPSVDDAIALEH